MLDTIFENAPVGTFVEVTQLPNNRKYIPATQANTSSILGDFGGKEDVYYGPALRKSQGSTKEDVYGSRVLWADVDNPNKPLCTIPPSITVWSGGGWHLYWLLDKYCTDIEKLETVNKYLMEDVKGDNCWNANRLLRVPGTINSKYPARVELRQAGVRTWDIEDFHVLSDVDELWRKTRHKVRTGEQRGYRSRSERDWAIVEQLVIRGATDAFIFRLYELQPCGDKFRDPETPDGPAYLAETIANVRAKSRTVKIATKLLGDLREGLDGYYTDRVRGAVRLSTFVFEPELLLEGDREDILVGSIRASGFTWSDVRLPRSAFNDRKSLDKQLGTSAWVWLGKDDDVRQLLPFLLGKLKAKGLPRSRATSILGRYGRFFVGSTQTIDVENLWPGAEGPLVYSPTGRESPDIVFRTDPNRVHPNLSALFHVNSPEVVIPVVGWFAASAFKPLFEAINIRFPILNIYGTRGSGKTSLIRTLQRLVGYEKTIAYNCTTTPYVTMALLGSSNAVPVAFSEYRGSVAEKFLRWVLLAYDTGHDARGRGDQTTVDYPLSAPFSVDGEDIIQDAACRERIIAVGLHPETIAEGTPCFAAFGSLRDEPLENFALGWYQYTLTYSPETFQALVVEAHTAIEEAFPEVLPDRIRNNITVVWAGALAFCRYAEMTIPFGPKDALSGVLHAVWSEELGRGMTLADEFCETLVNAVARDQANFYAKVEGDVLWFQLSTAFEWWLKQRRMAGRPTLERDAIRNQLHERFAEKGGKGQYIVRPMAKGDRWCYGVSLPLAYESGLEIPSKLGTSTFVAHFITSKES